MKFEEWAATTCMSHCEYSYAKHAWQAAQEAEAKKSEMLVQCLLAIKGISNDHVAVSLAEHALKDWGKDALDT